MKQSIIQNINTVKGNSTPPLALLGPWAKKWDSPTAQWFRLLIQNGCLWKS